MTDAPITKQKVYLLADTYTDGPHKGKPQYFRCWTAIGPCATNDREQAQRFASEQDALNSPAYTHWASNYKVVEVSGA